MGDWLTALTDVAFPAVVAFYLLHTVQRALESLTAKISDLILTVSVGLAVIAQELDIKQKFNDELMRRQGQVAESQKESKK